MSMRLHVSRLHLSRLTVAAVAATVGLTGLVGFSAVASTSTPGSVDSSAPRASADAQAAARSGIRLAGALGERGPLSRAELKAVAQKTVKVSFLTKSGQQSHTYTGPTLLAVLRGADPAFSSDEHDVLRFAILVKAIDGFQAVLSWGEIDPELAHKKVLIALTEDGKVLARPRLVVPGDAHGARQIYDVASVSLLRLSTLLNQTSAGSQDPDADATHAGH